MEAHHYWHVAIVKMEAIQVGLSAAHASTDENSSIRFISASAARA
jgi:hypothetical protein